MKSIYILCPPNKATGGPEALHQLGHLLKKDGYDVTMLYSKRKSNPVHPFYKDYQIPYTYKVKDSADNVMIIPESMTNWMARFPLAEKKVWWLSLTFYEMAMNSREAKKNFLRKIFVPYKHTEYRFEKNKTITHWYQSQRTKEYLDTKELCNPAQYLCDYVADVFFENLPEIENFDKKDIITYNPKKGFDKIEPIIKLLPQYQWVPLSGMTRIEMRDLLRKAKLHVDFGYFPGRDKIPREALISGCCLLTGREGTSGFKEDLGIPEIYKLHENEITPEIVIEKIRHIMTNYDSVKNDFTSFRAFVLSEKQRMLDDIRGLFTKNNS